MIAGGIACAISAFLPGRGPQGGRAVQPLHFRSQLPAAADERGGSGGGRSCNWRRGPSWSPRPSPAKRPHCWAAPRQTKRPTKLRGLGAANVAVTCGADGIQLEGDARTASWIEAIPAPAVVDQTGAGDAFVGTLTARMVLGDSLPVAARYGAAAASLVVGGKGGTGLHPYLRANQCPRPPAPPKEYSHRTPKQRHPCAAGTRQPLLPRGPASRHRAPWPGRLCPRPHGRVHRKRHARLRSILTGGSSA